jgi:cyclopropane-fatty-acyl-phospholipid synthase
MAKNGAQAVMAELLAQAGVTINGDNAWDIRVHNDDLFSRLLSGGALALGESYMDGWWDCEALDQFFDNILRANLDHQIKKSFRPAVHVLKSKLFNLQKASRAYQVGEKHYDIGNDLYGAMLDKRMLYTCGYWETADNLDAAQEAKLELVCRKINLQPGMSVLDLGCGYGSFAKYAAEKFDARVTGVNVSKEQVDLGTELCRGLPVEIIRDEKLPHVYGKGRPMPERRRHRLYPYHRQKFQLNHKQPVDNKIYFPQRHVALHCPNRPRHGRIVCDGGLAQFRSALR